MNNNISKYRNCSIDIYRYICAIMVIAIHTHPFSDINQNLGFICTQVLTRIGVPFFFCVAGYFYIQKLETGKPFFPYLKRLISIYLIWSFVYFFIDFLEWGYSNPLGFIVNCVLSFTVYGSYYHFWFFPALIISVSLTTIAFKLKLSKILIPISIVLYIVGCIGCSYYELGTRIPILGALYQSSYFDTIRRIFFMGFPFFISGYITYRIKDKILNKYSNKKLIFFSIAAIAVWLVEIYFVCILNIENNIVQTFALYSLLILTMLLLIKNPLNKFENLSKRFKVIANFTYYSHPLFIIVLQKIFLSLFNKSIPETLLFILTTLITLILGLLLSRSQNKIIKKITY